MTGRGTMTAAVLHGAGDLRLQDWPVPEPGPEEVLLRVEAASICGTDVKVAHRRLPGQPPGPFVMGHEYAGAVVETGPGVEAFRPGDRVAVEVHKGCGQCANCVRGWYTSCLNYGNLASGHRAKGLTCDGGFARYAANHVNTLHRLPPDVSVEQACLVTTAASPLWTIELMGGYLAGETVLVMGPGPVGLMAVQLCKALGAERVILSGTRATRLAAGRQLGADLTVDVTCERLGPRVREATGGVGADSVLECSGGATALDEALESVRPGGRVGVVAFYPGPVQVDINRAVANNVRIYASRGEGGRSCARALALMSTGRLVAEPLITHRFPLEEIHRAFETATQRKEEALKVVVRT